MSMTYAQLVKPRKANRQDFGPAMSVGEASILSNLSECTIRNRCKDGTIKAVKVGRLWLINTDAFFELMGY